MKKLFIILILSLVVYEVREHKIENFTKTTINEQVIPEFKKMKDYLHALGKKESTNNYMAIGKYGHLGKYQFSTSTLQQIGINVDRDTFLNNPQLQEYAMVKLLKYNRKILKPYISKYDSTYFNGIFITESGLLAAAHLLGVGNVINYLKTGDSLEDGNGVKIESYLRKFKNYKIEL